MSEKINQQQAITTMFHGVLFAYQKGLASYTNENTTLLVDSFAIPYLDKLFRGDFLASIVKENAFTTLNSFGEFLKMAGMVNSFKITRKEHGFEFDIDGCSMADPAHRMLLPKDVVCPLGLVAGYLVEKSTGFVVVKNLTSFTDDGAKSVIEIGDKVSYLDSVRK